MLSRLGAVGGRHVVVRYGPGHDVHDEGVYNGADIDGARVVWARDMGDERNARLTEHFRGRTVWLLEPDHQPTKLSPYTVAPQVR